MKKLTVLAALFVLLPSLLSPNVTWGFSSGADSKALDRLAVMRAAGLRGDRSQLSIMRNIIKNPYPNNRKGYLPPADQLSVITALHTLTRLGVTEAVPDISQLIAENTGYPGVVNYARVQEARLLARSGTRSIADSRVRSAAAINKFYSVLGLSPDDLNTGTKRYQRQLLTEPQGAGNGTPCPVEVYAMRDLADMAYQGQMQDFGSLPGVSQIDFSIDYPSALKVRLAPLSKEARVKALIGSLVGTQVLGQDEDYNMQLLADEGLVASQAIAAQLDEMSKHRNQYREINFSALFRVLSAIGDQEQSPVVAQFMHDPDVNVRQDAELISHNLQSGLTSIYPRAAGY